MNDLQSIKSRIYTEGKIHTLLNALGCTDVRAEQGGGLIVCMLPPKFQSDNRRSVQIKNTEMLWGCIRSRGIFGDIYCIVGYIYYGLTTFDDVRAKIHDIKHWICTTLNYKNDVWGNEIAKDWNAWMRPIQRQRPKDVYEISNEVLNEQILHQYVPYGHMLWVKEGITLQTQRKFGVAYDIDSDRIVYPAHNKYGQLIGVKGRYVGSDTDILKEFKYVPLVAWSKSIELFNVHRALPYIQKQNQVIVVESAKACMLLTQWGYENVVGIEGFPIAPTQIRLLKALQVSIIFALDKNVSIDQLNDCTKAIKNRLVYYVVDADNLLNKKDSPTDNGVQVWEKLFQKKVKKH